jgi:hypothetical protein
VTEEQIQSKKDKAVRYLRDVIQDNDRADEVEDESPEDYAERKGLIISNSSKRRMKAVANGNNNDTVNDLSDLSKNDLLDLIDSAVETLEGAYLPESDRETLACAVGDAIDILQGNGADEDDDDGSDDDDQG